MQQKPHTKERWQYVLCGDMLLCKRQLFSEYSLNVCYHSYIVYAYQGSISYFWFPEYISSDFVE